MLTWIHPMCLQIDENHYQRKCLHFPENKTKGRGEVCVCVKGSLENFQKRRKFLKKIESGTFHGRDFCGCQPSIPGVLARTNMRRRNTKVLSNTSNYWTTEVINTLSNLYIFNKVSWKLLSVFIAIVYKCDPSCLDNNNVNVVKSELCIIRDSGIIETLYIFLVCLLSPIRIRMKIKHWNTVWKGTSDCNPKG